MKPELIDPKRAHHEPCHRPLGIAVVGAGYWGPNLVRNFRASGRWDLVAVCDTDPERAAKVIGPRSTTEIETSFDRLMLRDDVDAVAIATPAATHAALGTAALRAGKHVLVEKPLAHDAAEAASMLEVAREVERVLMVDHTYCYTPAVRYIRDAVANGVLGDLLYIDSVRINLGLVQPDVNVFWDLAPHDLSILDFVLPDGLRPERLLATGSDPLRTGRECVGHLSLAFGDDLLASVHVNWLSPTKIRQMVIGGSKRTLVWDDLNPQQRIAIHDRGVDLEVGSGGSVDDRRQARISYRLGDIQVPALSEKEALGAVVAELADAITEHRSPLTDGAAGLRVLEVLEGIDRQITGSVARAHAPALVG